ncbi:MAG: sugar-transfer associated ATP-grasp domain-containing protein [Reyranellaceae bacterium]
MKALAKWWRPNERAISRAMLALIFAYAALSLTIQLSLDISPWRADSPIEFLTDLMVLCGSLFAAVQLVRHRATPLRRAWISAILAMALIAFGESTDWFSDAYGSSSLGLQYKVPLWIFSVVALYRCARHYITQRLVRNWMLTGLTIQLVSNFIELATGLAPAIMLGHDESVELAIDYTELLSLLCYIAALFFTQVRPAAARMLAGKILGIPRLAVAEAMAWSPRAAQPVEIGAVARRLFHERRLFRRARYPTPYPVLHWPGLRQTVTLGMVALFGPALAPRIRQLGGENVCRQLVELVRLGMGQGIDAFTYYLLELYRPGGRRESRFYLTRYETKNGLFTVLNGMRGKPRNRPHKMTDKAAFAEACARLGVATPPILLAFEDGAVQVRAEAAELDRDLFAKLRRGRGTKRTSQFRRIGPHLYLDRAGTPLSLDQIVERLRAQSLERFGDRRASLIVQPRLFNHSSLTDLAEQSLVTIRIVTCRNERDEPEATHGILRILSKIEPAWDTAPDTEFGAAIDIRNGTLGWLTGDRPETCLQWYDRHPVTGAPILGRQVARWSELVDLALRAHAGFPNRILLGWDLALTPDGPVMLEGNSNMDVSFVQRTYREPIGRSRLGELLDHHLLALRRH